MTMRRSSHMVTYRGILSFAERALASAESKLKGAQRAGAYSLEGLTHEVEVGKMLVRMLRKGLPGRQTDLLELFNQIR